MDKMIYVAMSGANQILLAQQVQVNNLANVNTPGFRADFSQLQNVYIKGEGHPTRVYTNVEAPGSDFVSGTMINTGRQLDVAVQGDGWLVVQDVDGKEAYTRLGDLQISSTGALVTSAGRPLLGNGGPIAIPPVQEIEIGQDGTISVRPQGQGSETLAQIDRLKLVNPPKELLQKGPDGLFRMKDGSVPAVDGKVKLVSGTIEGSNVNAVGTLTDIISLARQFEVQLKLMRSAEENSAASTNIMKIG